MSTTEREPARPADEAETPCEVRGSSSYAITLAVLPPALAEPLPVAVEAGILSTVREV